MSSSCAAAGRSEAPRIVVHPTTKLRAHEAAMEAVAAGDLKPFDLAMMVYVTSNMDNASGRCVRRVETMMEKLEASRSRVFESLARLEAFGLIARDPNFGRHGRQLATHYMIGGEVEHYSPKTATPSKSCPEIWTPESRNLDPLIDSSRIHRFSHGDQADNRSFGKGSKAPPPVPAVDWADVADWLWRQVDYPRLYSDAAYSDAAVDLRHLRNRVGDDAALIAAIDRAKRLRLYGRPLLDFLENTRAGTGRRCFSRQAAAP